MSHILCVLFGEVQNTTICVCVCNVLRAVEDVHDTVFLQKGEPSGMLVFGMGGASKVHALISVQNCLSSTI